MLDKELRPNWFWVLYTLPTAITYIATLFIPEKYKGYIFICGLIVSFIFCIIDTLFKANKENSNLKLKLEGLEGEYNKVKESLEDASKQLGETQQKHEAVASQLEQKIKKIQAYERFCSTIDLNFTVALLGAEEQRLTSLYDAYKRETNYLYKEM